MNNSRELGRTVHITLWVSPTEHKLWDDERKKLKSNPSGIPLNMSEFIRNRVNESFEQIDVIAGRKLLRWYSKKVSEAEGVEK